MKKDKKKRLDPKWVNELISFMIGPQITIMMMKAPKSAKELTRILQSAVISMYEENDWADTNAWVVASGNRVWELYNTYMTAKLIKLFDDGVPDAPRIVTAGNGKMN